MTDASAVDLVFLATVGAIAGWLNTVAGAGSLLLLPALIFTGLAPDAANATNRLAILATTVAAVLGYRRTGLQVGRGEVVLTVAAAVGGAMGSYLATLLEADQVRIAIVVAMGIMLVLSLVPPRGTPVGEGDAGGLSSAAPPPTTRAPSSAAQLPRPTPAMIAAFLLIGIYGGFLQAGLGIVVLLYLSLAHGVGLVASNVVKSTVTLALTAVAIMVFAWRGEHIDLVRGGALALASGFGGWAGAHATVALGERFVRAVVVLAVLASMAKLVLDML